MNAKQVKALEDALDGVETAMENTEQAIQEMCWQRDHLKKAHRNLIKVLKVYGSPTLREVLKDHTFQPKASER